MDCGSIFDPHQWININDKKIFSGMMKMKKIVYTFALLFVKRMKLF